MDGILLITCPKCGYMIYGRTWRCPGCGGAGSHQPEKNKESRQNFLSKIIAAFLGAR
jgi:rubrerythrin